jgi:trigger factor
LAFSLERVRCAEANRAIPAPESIPEGKRLMSTDEREVETAVSVSDESGEPEIDAAKPKRKLEIGVNITDVGPCKKHLKITIPREEIDRQYEESLETLRKDALVPGFRAGRAPRQLVVKRFRKQVSDQVKSNLLMSSLEQIDEDYKLDPITQPRLDVGAIEIPENGPMNFEMDIEVRPQFEVPNYKGLKVNRPVAELNDKHVDDQLTRFLEGHGRVVPKLEGAAELGDYLTADFTFIHPDGQVMNEPKEVEFRLQHELRFQDGAITDSSALVGAKPGDTRELEAKLGSSVVETGLRGATVSVRVRVNDLKRIRLPELNQSFLDTINIDTAEDLRAAVRDILERRIRTEQRQAIRRQLLDQLLIRTPFELPSDLVSREEKSTISRLVAQLKREGMSDDDIRAREAQIRANAHETTMRTLKEVLLLGKIAEVEAITVDEEDLALEIETVAARTGESVRRIRSRVEKEGGADSLANQILEQKVIDRIEAASVIEDVKVEIEPEGRVETLDITATKPADETSPAELDDPNSKKSEEGS